MYVMDLLRYEKFGRRLFRSWPRGWAILLVAALLGELYDYVVYLKSGSNLTAHLRRNLPLDVIWSGLLSLTASRYSRRYDSDRKQGERKPEEAPGG